MTMLERKILDVIKVKYRPAQLDAIDRAILQAEKYLEWMRQASAMIEANRTSLITSGKWHDLIECLNDCDNLLADIPVITECPELNY